MGGLGGAGEANPGVTGGQTGPTQRQQTSGVAGHGLTTVPAGESHIRRCRATPGIVRVCLLSSRPQIRVLLETLLETLLGAPCSGRPARGALLGAPYAHVGEFSPFRAMLTACERSLLPERDVEALCELRASR